jgi:nitroreductase
MSDNKNLIMPQPITEIIKKRKSVRTYKKQPLSDNHIKQLTNFIKNLKGPFETKIRFNIINSQVALNTDNVKLGTYGTIKGATNFILAAVNKDEKNIEQLGYQLEALVLYSTSLDLGTCWLGGTFKKGEFAKTMNLEENEMLPIVSPVGYISDSPHILSSLMRVAAGSNNRKSWSELFFNGSFDVPLTEIEAGEFKTPIEMVRLAPSASNKQPWRIVKDKDTFHFYLCRTKGYGKVLDFDIQRVDIGIAMCHFDLTAKELGLQGDWTLIEPKVTIPNDSYQYIISWKFI